MALSSWELKAIAIFSTFIVSLLFGILPWFLSGKIDPVKRNSFLGLANCLGGGLFFGLGFVHLLHESTHIFEHQLHSDIPLSYVS